jgi:nucleotide-binding universal stress UspA family protein
VIRRVLVALDGSARAAGVLAAAAEMSRTFDAELFALRVIFIPAEFPPSAHVAHGDPLRAHLTREAENALAAMCAPIAGIRIAPPIVADGQPWRAILDASDRYDVDLIVVGSHGYHGLDRLLGTTAGRVANMARRNVLVVHDRAGGERTSSSPGVSDGGAASG